MAYIGKTPTVGNFQKCDALTASATADYTLQVGSTNVVPESVNHMIVSLNGVIQAPTTAYTVSGSTLSFASALTSNDTIDFVILLGNVLDIGTPSDDTCGAAQIKDDLISGTTALAVAPADTDEFLVSDAGTLKRIDYSLIKASNTPAFEASLSGDFTITDNTNTKVEYDTETFDTDGCYDNSTNYRFLPTTAGKYYVYHKATVHGNATQALDTVSIAVRKNSVRYETDISTYTTQSLQIVTIVSNAIIDMNGSSDYLEGWAYARGDEATSVVYSTRFKSIFGAYKLII